MDKYKKVKLPNILLCDGFLQNSKGNTLWHDFIFDRRNSNSDKVADTNLKLQRELRQETADLVIHWYAQNLHRHINKLVSTTNKLVSIT